MGFQHCSHAHPLVLMEEKSKSKEAFCSACRELITGSSYICSQCEFYLHKTCAGLPNEINHPLHLQHPLILDAKLQDVSSKFCCSFCRKGKGFVYRYSSCQFGLDVIKDAGDDFTREIQHFSHEHSLKLKLNDGEVEGNRCCNGCMLSISNLFYCCDQCDFFLHKSCAELSMKIRYWRTRHPLTLHSYTIFKCDSCLFYSSGFAYHCNECDNDLYLQCYAIPEVLALQGHEHPFFNHKCEGKCNACGSERRYPGFRCKDYDSILCCRCVTLPHTAQHKYDEHPLMLLYRDDNHPKFQINVIVIYVKRKGI
ncbi:hypothetical protein SLEP1_g47822 [Rubroshorea leprosula]|uniref:Phorbol-ester/DAG-type domain-containing protein n=1 Tax=Rubroshorea leprosula TaxID=152421 RepID=A0AAV5LSQ0_9ROSI|nr:hypothetical protein SLEP1_g47822 [Rubroshorea leprosula]